MTNWTPTPLTFEPIFIEKVWGGRNLEQLGKALPDGVSIGESWEIADLAQTSSSLASGGAARSTIASGPHAGKPLNDLVRAHPRELLGSDEAFDAFPLLIKYLDANDNLSVQVHPSPEYAAAHPEAHLKTESWYILEAEPGAVIYKGIKAGVTPEQFRAALEASDNDPQAFIDTMIAVPVRAGDLHHLPSGTCHALGAGIVVAEVQTPSDTTFRVYDWGRSGRELHVEQSMQCIEFGPPAQQSPIRADPLDTRSELLETEFYALAEMTLAAGRTRRFGTPGVATVWMCLRGAGTYACEGCEPVAISAGETVLLPATLPGGELSASADMTVLEARLHS